MDEAATGEGRGGDVQRVANERTMRRNKVSCKSFIWKDLEGRRRGRRNEENGAVCGYWPVEGEGRHVEEGFLGEFANANRLSHRCMEWWSREGESGG